MLTEQKQQFIEDTGLFFERMGVTRMAGRIMGYLMVCDPPYQSMPEIVTALQASKSTISTSLRELQTFFLIERMALPGERRDFYRLAEDVWYRSFSARMGELTNMRQLAEKGLLAMTGEPPEKRQRLELLRDMYEFMEREFPKLLEKWEQEKRAKGYD